MATVIYVYRYQFYYVCRFHQFILNLKIVYDVIHHSMSLATSLARDQQQYRFSLH